MLLFIVEQITRYKERALQQGSGYFFISFILLLFASSAMHSQADEFQPIVIEFEKKPPKSIKKAVNDLKKTFVDQLSELETPFDQLKSQRRSYIKQQQLQHLTSIIHSQGYFNPLVTGRIKKIDEQRQIIFKVNFGEVYHIGEVKVLPVVGEQGRHIHLPDLKSLTLQPKKIARAERILATESEIKSHVAASHCLLTLNIFHEVKIDHQKKTLDVSFKVVPGPEASFGMLRYEGLESVSRKHMDQYTNIKRGECFRREKLTQARLALRKSGLFTGVLVHVGESVSEQGEVDIIWEVTERPHRTIKLGLNYSSDLGLGLNAGWEHRNLFSHSEKLSTSLSLAEFSRSLDAELSRPFFIREDQTLKLGIDLDEENSEAFESFEVTLSASVERELNKNWLAGIGAKYGLSHVEDKVQEEVEDFALLRFPMYGAWDSRDNLLNPKSGSVVRMEIAPYIDTLDDDIAFTRVELKSSYYYGFSWFGNKTSVFAMRAALGGIAGDETLTIPATERYYIGGGGSVRGYDYQSVGLLDENQDPVGGRSYFETSLEMRLPIYQQYGLVTFVDGGALFDKTTPNVDPTHDDMQWGAGLGLRYYTAFGPLRLDVAAPLDRREDIDDQYQIYISVGEAF